MSHLQYVSLIANRYCAILHMWWTELWCMHNHNIIIVSCTRLLLLLLYSLISSHPCVIVGCTALYGITRLRELWAHCQTTHTWAIAIYICLNMSAHFHSQICIWFCSSPVSMHAWNAKQQCYHSWALKTCMQKVLIFGKKSVHQLNSSPWLPECKSHWAIYAVVFDGVLLEYFTLLRLQPAVECKLITTLTCGDILETGGWCIYGVSQLIWWLQAKYRCDKQMDGQTDRWMASQLFLYKVQLSFKVTCARVPNASCTHSWYGKHVRCIWNAPVQAQNLMIKLQ